MSKSETCALAWRWQMGEPVFNAGKAASLWRVQSGVLRLDQHVGDAVQLVMLVLPGDLVGTEALCHEAYTYHAHALTDVVLIPVDASQADVRQQLMVETILQQPQRSHDMARVRTGSVGSRLAALLGVLGHRVPSGLAAGVCEQDGDAIRNSLPPLRVLADVVDAKPETVCRALAQLLPPRARKTGPRRWSKASQAAAQAMAWVGDSNHSGLNLSQI